MEMFLLRFAEFFNFENVTSEFEEFFTLSVIVGDSVASGNPTVADERPAFAFEIWRDCRKNYSACTSFGCLWIEKVHQS